MLERLELSKEWELCYKQLLKTRSKAFWKKKKIIEISLGKRAKGN